MNKKTKNKIFLKENYAEVLLEHKTYGRAVTKVDVEDLQIIKNLRWGLVVNKKLCTLYVGNSNKGVMTYLHRLVTKCPDGFVIDHINHDTLDNRKANLRVCSCYENAQNRIYYNKRGA